MIKICSKCNIEKNISEFYPKKICKFGVNSYCKKCDNKKSKEYRKNNPEVIENLKKEDYKKNKKQYIKRAKIWASNNKQKRKEIRKRWELNNPEKIKELRKIKNNRRRFKLTKTAKEYQNA